MKTYTCIRPLAIAVSLAPLSVVVPAQENLDPVVITATRFEQPVTQTIAPVTIITRKDIERKQFSSVDEVLQSVQGVQVLRQGGRGQTQSLYLRGTPRSRHTLVLVDGVRWSDSTTGSAQLEHLALQQIERIEVLRGPASARYGSDAMGGVVQIFTREPEGREMSVGLEAGSYGHFGGNVSVSQPLSDRTAVTGSLGYEQQDGFDVQPASGQTDNDGFELTNANLNLSHQLNERWSSSVNGQLNQGRSEFDSSDRGDQTEFVRQRLSTEVTRETGNNDWTFSGYYDLNESVTYGNGTAKDGADEYITKQLGLNSDFRQSVSQTLDLTLGAELRREDVGASTTAYETAQRNTAGAYIGVGVFRDAWQLDAVARTTTDDQFGSALTYNLGLEQFITTNLTVYGSLGSAYAVPTFNELYWPGFANPNLEPEKSLTYEGGVKWVSRQLDASATAFRTSYTNRISGGQNESDAQVDGVELKTTVRPVSMLEFTGYLDVYATENESGDNLIRIPDYSGVLSAEYSVADWSAGINYLFEGERRDVVNGSYPVEYTSVGSFETLGVNLRFNPIESLRIGARADNLFDSTYQLTDGYSTPGRNYRLTVNYQL